MTIERAIEILNPEHREHYESIDPVNDACRMGMEALKKYFHEFILKSPDNLEYRLDFHTHQLDESQALGILIHQ